MPRLDETQQLLRDAEQGARQRTRSAFASFSNFALRDNVLEVAVGLMYIFTRYVHPIKLLTIGCHAQTRSILHSMRKLARNRRHPPRNLPPPIPLPQSRRKVCDVEAWSQLQRDDFKRLQHERPSAVGRSSRLRVRQLSG